MIAYEFYWLDPIKGYELLGVLPERRKNSERITQKSVMGWAEKIFGGNLSTKDIYFIQVTINEYTGMTFRPTPFCIIRQKVKK
jgi:hypothetical protein